MADESLTQPAESAQPEVAPPGRTKPCHIGRSYSYLCQVGDGTAATFTYSHVAFGKVVWHR